MESNMAKGMNGIINSDLNPGELTHEELLKALKEPDYLIGLLQKHCYDHSAFNANNSAFGDVTPNKYKEVVSKALEALERGVWDAIHNYESFINQEIGVNFGEWPSYECDYFSDNEHMCGVRAKFIAFGKNGNHKNDAIAFSCPKHQTLLESDAHLNGIVRWEKL